MKLLELNAHFIASTLAGSWHRVDTIQKANGVMFQCPKCAEGKEPGVNECDCEMLPHAEWCDAVNGAHHRKGAHHVICWFRNPRVLAPVPPEMDPKPGRWWAEGDSLANLTFGHGEPHMAKSVLLTSGCGWHGFVTNGEASPS